jgi:membrane protease YdiL (CAAX protease family)
MQDYWCESRRPLVSLAFIAPLLVIYEVGVLVLGAAAVRNGADVWLRTMLDWTGLGGYFLLPFLTVAILLAWHHTTGEPWKVSAGTLYGMLLESAVLAVVLLVLAHLQGVLLQLPPLAASFGRDAMDLLGRMVGFFGAGIYEEVLFRLLMLPAVAAVIAWLGGSLRMKHLGSIAITSLLFSAAHHLGAHGESFALGTFVFRFLAGAFFAVLFVYRGFGIAAGTHALYDILVGWS